METTTKRKTRGKANPIDAHVGSRMRMRRTLLGMSQEALGGHLDLTFQQMQKYERGANRISAGRLHQLAQVLDVPIQYFFDEMADDIATAPTAPGDNRDPLARRETLELVRAYYRIADPKVRKRVFELVKTMGKTTRVKVAEPGHAMAAE